MAYILPPMCFIKLTGNKSLRNVLPSYVCVGFGVFVMVVSTIQSLVKIVTEKEDRVITVYRGLEKEENTVEARGFEKGLFVILIIKSRFMFMRM